MGIIFSERPHVRKKDLAKSPPPKKKLEFHPPFSQTTTLSPPDKMRPLTEEETQTLFAKLANYTGNSLKNLIAPLDSGPNADRYVFRLHQSRCYYVRLSLANLATSVARDNLLSLGTCLGRLLYLHTLCDNANFPQANSPRPVNSDFTSPPFPSSLSTLATRSGSSPMEKCHSCMEVTL